MYTIDIEGAGKGSYQRVKKLLKEHGVYEPANCVYAQKKFHFTAPLANGSRSCSEQLKLLQVELANQCTLSVTLADKKDKKDKTSDKPSVDETNPQEAVRVWREIERINKNLGQVVNRLSTLQNQVAKLKEPQGDEVTSPEDLLELIEDLTESVADLESQVEGQERGITSMMNAMTVILSDVGIALDDNASAQGKEAAKQRFFHVLRVMQMQLHQAKPSREEDDGDEDGEEA